MRDQKQRESCYDKAAFCFFSPPLLGIICGFWGLLSLLWFAAHKYSRHHVTNQQILKKQLKQAHIKT